MGHVSVGPSVSYNLPPDRFLQSSVEKMAASDGYGLWRRSLNTKLAAHVQRSFAQLQNPVHCDRRSILSCATDRENCGWGCQVHHVIECLSEAIGLGRLLVYDSSGFRYGEGSLERAFIEFAPRNCGVSANLSIYRRIDGERLFGVRTTC